MSDYPCKAWFIHERGRASEHTLYGETSRSWLADNRWHPSKISKRTKRITEAEYLEYQWAYRNAYQITLSIWNYSLGVSPGILRKIADLIGYQEATDGHR